MAFEVVNMDILPLLKAYDSSRDKGGEYHPISNNWMVIPGAFAFFRKITARY